jgi:hypothetical protein
VKSHPSHFYLTCMIAAAAILAAACDRKEEIQTYTVPKTLAISSEPIADTADTATAPQWTVPSSWTLVPGPKMRFASFSVSADHPEVELTVVPLDGQAGSIIGNVNRWQKQLGLPPSDPKDIESLLTVVDLAGTPAWLFDFTGAQPTDGKPQQRVLAAIVRQPTQTWFFKLTGPMDVVTSQKDNFDSFIHSLKFPAPAPDATAKTPTPSPPAAAPADASPDAPPPLPITFTTPSGWTQQTKQNQFRVVGFDIAAGNQSAMVSITRMPENSGSVLDNVNRWRGQVNLERIADPAQTGAQVMQIAGLDAQWWDFEGPASADQPATGIVVAMLTHGSEWWFFKLQGPAPLVAAQKDSFLTFLHSVQFQGNAQ